MRHAQGAALDGIEPLLDRLRALDGLTERSRGVFYLGSRAFLHFHEDPSGIYADVRTSEDFERVRATDPDEQARLVALVTEAVAASAATRSHRPHHG